ncbi:signal peptide protein [Paraburkholderia sp. Se-20369]|nr:signal peptide protein [Paraburkholderia sp. Se-20369]
MPIFIVLFALIALVWGAVHTYHVIAAQFGPPVAVAAAVLAGALTIALAAWWLKRRRDIAPNTTEQGWTHIVHRAWGELRVSATQGLLWLSHDGADGRYTLSQLDGCQTAPIGGRWHLVVQVRDAARAEWKLPMMNKRDAQRWARVLMLAKDNRL